MRSASFLCRDSDCLELVAQLVQCACCPLVNKFNFQPRSYHLRQCPRPALYLIANRRWFALCSVRDELLVSAPDCDVFATFVGEWNKHLSL